MKHATLQWAGMILVSGGLLAGCGGVAPLKRITLSPPQTERLPARPSDWHVMRVQVPEYLDNYHLQIRSDAHVLSELPNAKWAIRLPVAMTRLLQETIDEKLVQGRNKPYDVHVDVSTFEPQPGGTLVLAAQWRVTDSADTTVARDTALIRESLPAGSSDNAEVIGRAMSNAVRELAMQILAQTG
ncbi:MAG: hypothetical protein CMP08_03005 [Xanthomonadales bacterium]|mgnify:CR=1 FL=1|nr:hypothetical protein [Xanthomonadales bacterium]